MGHAHILCQSSGVPARGVLALNLVVGPRVDHKIRKIVVGGRVRPIFPPVGSGSTLEDERPRPTQVRATEWFAGSRWEPNPVPWKAADRRDAPGVSRSVADAMPVGALIPGIRSPRRSIPGGGSRGRLLLGSGGFSQPPRSRTDRQEAGLSPGARKFMAAKPLIGINTDYRPSRKEHAALSFVAAGYYDGVIAAGGIPVIVPPLEDEEDLIRLLDSLDGMVLVGGADLDPRNDGYMPHPAVRPMDARREAFDRMLARHVCARHMPVLAVGSGMQLLNITEGGTLFLHLPEDCPRALPHKDPVDAAHRHALLVERNSVMERVYGDGEIRVNSMHHMAIDDLAESFRVTARAPDGVIEAIESVVDGWVVIGTQFHPEAESASALDAKIFEEFVIGITGEVPEMRLVA